MFTKFPKDDERTVWTRHIKNKMMFYGISESKIKRVLKSPKRTETGIAPNTSAAMQPNDRGKKKEEIWVMYQQQNQIANNKNQKLRRAPKFLLISAWRYPGVTKPGTPIHIPDDVLADLDANVGKQ